MGFDAALGRLLLQVPEDGWTTCGALARALGDIAAARAVAERVRENPDLPRRNRVATEDRRLVLTGAAAPPGRPFDRFRGGGGLRRLRKEQERMRALLDLRGAPRPERIGGIDVAYRGDLAFAAAVSTDTDGRPLEIVHTRLAVRFPYVPGYLAARELPGIRAAWRRLRRKPDVLLIDGHGTSHPAGFGIACAAGVALDVPTIGVAKSRLVGTHAPLRRVGDRAPLRVDGERRGWALAGAFPSRPLYVSPGHRVSIESCVEIILPLLRSRIPEPLRIADAESKSIKMEHIKTTRRNWRPAPSEKKSA